MRNKRIRHAVVLALTMAGLTSAATAQSIAPNRNGKIAFVSSKWKGQTLERHGISVMNPDGSGQAPLTTTQPLCPQPNSPPWFCVYDHLDYRPAWSPDGKQLAFIRSVPAPNFSTNDVFLMDADGSNQRRISQSGNVDLDSNPTWSPDGTKLAFVDQVDWLIYVMNADGSNRHPIGPGRNPAWSPDGSKLAFSFGGTRGLQVMNPDGSGRTQITAPSPSAGLIDYDWGPAWSPDGRKIVFNRYVGCDMNDNCQSMAIWTVNADGGNPAKLADIDAYGRLAWSPDGTKIVFSNGGSLFTMEADGSNVTNITPTPGESAWQPSWQPLATAACPSTIDCAEFFIRQQYRDFLAREPEPEGLQFYLDILNRCNPADVECVRFLRGVVSANFFRSPEFGRKGSYVMYLYLVSIGQRPVTVAELATKNDPTLHDRPHYSEFLTDLASISTPNDDRALTDAKKDALAADWVNRAQIQSLYPASLSNAQFAQRLADNAGVVLSSATQAAIANAQTRAQILRIIVESPEVDARFFKESFVTMEYFGYLRRDPEDCHNPANWGGSDPSQCGFIFHNHRFTLVSDPHVMQNIIVRGFIESPEYRTRF